MKKRIFLILILIISLIALPTFAESDSQAVDVIWELEGCWISLEASPEHLIAPSGGTAYTNWSVGQTIGGDTPHEVTIRTSCKGYDLSVKSTGFDIPTGHKSQLIGFSEVPYKDFEFYANVTGGGVSSQIQNYKAFDSLNTNEQILMTNNARTTYTDMYYRYHLDNLDVAGQYTMNLTYTVSTN